jgi:hypothetical protein
LWRGRLAERCVTDGRGSRYCRRGIVIMCVTKEESDDVYVGESEGYKENGETASWISGGRAGEDFWSTG